ncbi:MAG: signal peptide peptidase SppA [Thiovulaceae bacterium]|nr:signal peptide peptidase SppA [Sulfurimonadaceae bacterium]
MQKIKKALIKLARFIKFLTANFKGVLLFMFIVYLLIPTSKQSIVNANLVRINLGGTIMDATKVLGEIKEARLSKSIKGVLFVIDSPGGAVAPSIEIAYAIKELKQEKPVVAYAAGTIASGSYYAAIWSNKIIANPGSLVGSIGVIMQGYNVESLLEKIGVKTQTAKAGDFKEAGTMHRVWTKIERDELEKVINNTYKMFVTDVANARSLKIKDEKHFANAHIFTSQGALDVGLIDQVGTISDAIESLKALTHVKKIIWKEPTALDNFVERLSTSFGQTLQTFFPTMVLK